MRGRSVESRTLLAAFACVFAGHLVWATPAQAAPQEGSAVKAPPPFKTAGPLSHKLQKYSGLNFVSNNLTSALATAAASLYMRGYTPVKIRSYNFSDLLQGEFELVEAKTRRGKIRGIPVGPLQVRTTTPFKLSGAAGKIALSTPVLLNINGAVSERLASRALKSRAVIENMRFLKIDLPGLGEQQLQIQDPLVRICGEQVEVRARLITAGAPAETAVNLLVKATPQLEKERFIMLKDMDVRSEDVANMEHFGPFVAELLNPLVDFGRMDRQTHAFRVNKLTVKGGTVQFDGRLLLAPRIAKK